MKRRLYFLFPENAQARSAVADIAALGVDNEHIHALARPEVNLSGLPAATERQRHDSLHRLEQVLWGSTLLLFVLALASLTLALMIANIALAVIAAVIMLATAVGGVLFAMRMPRVHLDEFREALRHGEILLMVDVTRERVFEVEELMHHRYPQVVTGGSAWTPDAFGV